MPLLAVGVFWGPGFIWQDDHLDDDEDDKYGHNMARLASKEDLRGRRGPTRRLARGERA